jgi:hypothetical protein
MTIIIEPGITIEGGIFIGQLPATRIPHTITANLNAQVSTAQVKFGTGSYTSNSLGGFLTVTPFSDLALGSGDWTIELWYFPQRVDTITSTMIDFRPVSGAGFFPTISCLGGTSTTTTQLIFFTNGVNRITSAVNITPNNQWNSVSVVKYNGSTKMYVNGTQTGSTYTDPNTYLSAGCIIGANGFSRNGQNPLQGYFDEIRISNIARYTSNYTPATEPFVNDPYTLLLIHCDGTNGSKVFTDSTQP